MAIRSEKTFLFRKLYVRLWKYFRPEMKRKFMKIWSLLRRVPLMVYISGTLVFEMAFIDENSFIQS